MAHLIQSILMAFVIVSTIINIVKVTNPRMKELLAFINAFIAALALISSR